MVLLDIDYEELHLFLSHIKEEMQIEEDGDLFVACRDQPDLCARAGEAANTVKSLAKRAKVQLDRLKSKISSDIRRKPKTYGFDRKPTDKAVEDTVLQNEEYNTALDEYFDIEEIANDFQIVAKAIEVQRKSMLRDIVSMTLFNYYSSGNKDMRAANDAVSAYGEQQIAKLRRERVRGQKNKSEKGQDQKEN